MTFTVIPAMDLRDGRVVRLQQGDYGRETHYAYDPELLARMYAEAGARWLHLVDLDGARDGGYGARRLLDALRHDGRLSVQTGGGVRNEADVRGLLDAGAARVVIGSLAVREPVLVAGWLRRFGSERITIALDTRLDGGMWRLPVHGWTETGDRQLFPLLEAYVEAGLKHLLCTDIARDGMLTGPNLTLYRTVLAHAPGIELQASGGIRDLADIRAVREAGCRGVVIGKAVLDGHLDLIEALSC
jgi:phosphoribosylformimino-5-aminoimidazole carboxamide ribotide isomerase